MHSWDRIPSSSRTCHLAGRVYSTPHKWANDRQMMADVLYFYFWWVGDVFVWYMFLEENDVRAVFSHRWDLGHKVCQSCPQNSLKKTCEVGGHRISPTPTLYVVNLDFAHLCSWTAPDFWAFLIQARTAVTSMTMPPRQWHSFDKLVGTPGNLQKHRWTQQKSESVWYVHIFPVFIFLGTSWNTREWRVASVGLHLAKTMPNSWTGHIRDLVAAGVGYLMHLNAVSLRVNYFDIV